MKRGNGEAGMTTTQVTILMPVLLFWIMLIVQYGLWYHAKQVANAAAAEAVDAAQTPAGTAALGERAAQEFLTSSGNLSATIVSVERDVDRVVAEVHGDAPQLVPGFPWSVTARVEAPVERFIPESERE
jgi:Flp pilus assembly protein TadG